MSMGRWIAVLLFAASVVLGGCERGASGPSFRATDVTGAEFGRDIQLNDFNGQPRKLSDFRGKAVAVFFGYTHCPDVCPTTLAELASAIRKMGPEGEKVEVLFITADPERDTPEVLKQYVTSFNPRFLGLRGSPEETAQIAREFKVIIQKNASGGAGNYTVDHSSGTYLYDPQGRLRVYVSYGQGADVFAHDLTAVLKSG
jgi:protein SCO1/2